MPEHSRDRQMSDTAALRRSATRIDVTSDAAKSKLLDCFADLLAHSGHGELRVEARWERAGVREVIFHYGRQFRFLIREAET